MNCWTEISHLKPHLKDYVVQMNQIVPLK